MYSIAKYSYAASELEHDDEKVSFLYKGFEFLRKGNAQYCLFGQCLVVKTRYESIFISFCVSQISKSKGFF